MVIYGVMVIYLYQLMGKKARYVFTQSCGRVGSLQYINYLRYIIYNDLCNPSSSLTPWPKNNASPYWFGTKTFDWLAEIDKEWYQLNRSSKKTKIY